MSRSTSTNYSRQRTLSSPVATGRPTLTRSVTFKRMTVTVGGGIKEGEGRNAWQLLFDRKLLLLIPLLFYSGLQAAYISADFTRYVVQPLLGAQWMGGAMMVFGVAIAVCCFIAVRFAKGLSSIRLMLLLGAASQTAVLILTWLFQDRAMSKPAAFALVFSCALLWGIGATAFQSQITALLPLHTSSSPLSHSHSSHPPSMLAPLTSSSNIYQSLSSPLPYLPPTISPLHRIEHSMTTPVRALNHSEHCCLLSPSASSCALSLKPVSPFNLPIATP
ncbi:unnamed protein product [Closterium sp. NIES-65]|nr:unnamed protein product [Closterium sp. NIES-65]